jgi:prepilin-type processing-associated H-X9-DG protein
MSVETGPWKSAINAQCAQYHGIAGACPYGNFTDSTAQNPLQILGGAFTLGGCVSNRGMITDFNCQSIRDCSDGTSNTMIVGEMSAPIFDQNNAAHDRRPGGNFAWFMGGWNGTLFGMTMGPNYSNTTIRYAPNTRVTITGSTWSLQGVGSDPGTLETDADRSNTPLSSLHSGGVNVLMTDGTVKFISNSIDLNTYTVLAVRNDGLTAGTF